MINEANVKFYMYRTEQFMTYASKYIGSNVSDNAIEEIETIRTRDRENYEAYSEKFNQLVEIVREIFVKYGINLGDDIEFELFTDSDGSKEIIIHCLGKLGVTIIPVGLISYLKFLSSTYGIKIEVVDWPV
jgi:hypothetical protein